MQIYHVGPVVEAENEAEAVAKFLAVVCNLFADNGGAVLVSSYDDGGAVQSKRAMEIDDLRTVLASRMTGPSPVVDGLLRGSSRSR